METTSGHDVDSTWIQRNCACWDGNTRTIKIRDSIRQGGVLSVIEYANLIDEIAKEISTEKIGTTKIGTTEIERCLLWMEDVALIHKNNKIELQKMLDITDEIAKIYHVKKSQTITIGKNQETKFKLGDMEMDNTETYKYLGITINNKGSMEDHIKQLKGSSTTNNF